MGIISKLWSYVIVFSIGISFVIGTTTNVNKAVFDSMGSALNYILNIIFLMGFWGGINNIILNTRIKYFFKKLFKPFYKLIYGKEISDEILEYMSLNTFGNMMGLGNISTLAGLEVMKKLECENNNDKKISDDIIVFTVLNTASIQILPISILNIRYLLGAKIVSDIIIYVWIVSFSSFILLIIITKIYLKVRR